MPSWVTNIMVVKGESEDIYRFYGKYCRDGDFDFNNIIAEPEREDECPDRFNLNIYPDNRVGPNSDGKDWFNWYLWRTSYWGCKWNARFVLFFDSPFGMSIDEYESNRLEIRFDTPWSNPEGIIDRILEENPHLDIAFYSIRAGSDFYEVYDRNECRYFIETPLNEFEEFDRKYDFVKKEDLVAIYGASEGSEDWAIPALEKCQNIVYDADEMKANCDFGEEPDFERVDVLLYDSGVSSMSDFSTICSGISFGANLLAGYLYDSEMTERLKGCFEEAIVEDGYLLGIDFHGIPKVVVPDKWCQCLGCGRKVKEIAVEVHKKCPFCEATSFRPIDDDR